MIVKDLLRHFEDPRVKFRQTKASNVAKIPSIKYNGNKKYQKQPSSFSINAFLCNIND